MPLNNMKAEREQRMYPQTFKCDISLMALRRRYLGLDTY